MKRDWYISACQQDLKLGKIAKADSRESRKGFENALQETPRCGRLESIVVEDASHEVR
jgi:hypothetical protein